MRSLVQFIKFGIVGLSNTLISQLIYMACVALGAHYLAASIIAFLISVLNAFFWQNKFVFKEDENGEKRIWWRVLLKTYAAYAFTGLFLANILLVFWIEIIKLESFTAPLTEFLNSFGINMSNHEVAVDLAPILNIFVNVPINFLINKFWAYKQKTKPDEAENVSK